MLWALGWWRWRPPPSCSRVSLLLHSLSLSLPLRRRPQLPRRRAPAPTPPPCHSDACMYAVAQPSSCPRSRPPLRCKHRPAVQLRSRPPTASQRPPTPTRSSPHPPGAIPHSSPLVGGLVGIPPSASTVSVLRRRPCSRSCQLVFNPNRPLSSAVSFTPWKPPPSLICTFRRPSLADAAATPQRTSPVCWYATTSTLSISLQVCIGNGRGSKRTSSQVVE